MDERENSLTRRDLLKYGVKGAAAFAAVDALAGWGGVSEAFASAATSGARPVRGGTLRVGMLSAGSAETVDVRKVANVPDYARVLNLYDPLFFQVPGGIAPGLATSGEPNKDATVWTLKLRKGVTWHDGKPFTADDVVYTIKSWGSKQSFYQATAAALVDLKNVRKLDSHTVRVPLLKPFASFLAMTSWFTAVVVQEGTTFKKKPIGTGPFKFGSFTPGSSSTFPANRDYWRGTPYVDNLVINSSFTDEGARLNAVLSGQIDIAPGAPPALAKANAHSGRLVLGTSPGPGFIAVVMRVNVPPFNDPRVVQAFKLAVDRQAVIRSAFAGYATLGNDAPGATLKYWASELKPKYDPEKAKALLKAAGQEHLSIPLYTAETLPGQNETATVVSANLKAIGVNAPLKLIPVSTYFTSASPGWMTNQRKLSTTYWNVFQPALGAFYESALTPYGQYPETGWNHVRGGQKLITPALAATKPAKARALWRAVQEEQIHRGGYLIPANFDYLDAYAPSVHGVETNQAGNNANYVYYKAWLSK